MTGLQLQLDLMVDVLKAVAEPSRLRILALLSRGDLTVSDLTTILGQSQPRVSRHLKLLGEADLIDRYQEGAWAYFRLADNAISGDLARGLLARLDKADALVERDMERLSQVKSSRQEKAAAYFSANAGSWDQIRRLHVSENAVEVALKKVVGDKPFQAMLDVGTGTGRLLELLRRFTFGVSASTSIVTCCLWREPISTLQPSAMRRFARAMFMRCLWSARASIW